MDWYYINLVMGENSELRSEDPEYISDQYAKYPERQFGFFRSAWSHILGSNCYASTFGWITPIAVLADTLFNLTQQKFRTEEFINGKVFPLNSQSFVLSDGDILRFPLDEYLKSINCVVFLHSKNEDLRFDSYRPTPSPENCLVHKSGSMILLDDNQYRYFLYDTAFLNHIEAKLVNKQVAELAANVSTAIGLSPEISCRWSSLDDEKFEFLCYDLIYADPKFDSTTIRKMGKSRSRDGGRDIVVSEAKRAQLIVPRKWIFQCKLVKDGSSLSATRLTDVGDMLEQYGAQGFGVMTSTLIDATLYDKLGAICGKRSIAEHHFSVLELERQLARYPNIRKRYFPDG